MKTPPIIPQHIIQAMDALLSPYRLSMELLLEPKKQNVHPFPSLLTYNEAARMLSVSTMSVKRLANAEELKRVRFGSRQQSLSRIERNSVIEFINRKMEKTD